MKGGVAALRAPMIAAIATLLVVLGAAGALAADSAPAESASAGGNDSYIVLYEEGVDRSRSETGEREDELGFEADYVYNTAVEGFAARLDADQLSELEDDPAVASIEPDSIVQATGTVPLVPGEPTPPTGVRRIADAPAGMSRDASDVAVAVLDTGIQLDHPDLNVVGGYNCISPGTPARDVYGHGTHVAGTIAARNNGAGVTGVAPDTPLYSVKVLGDSGSGTRSSVICGIDWVTANADSKNIRVANMSLGGSGSPIRPCQTTTDDEHLAICASTAAGVNYVVAAGNDYESFDSSYIKVPAAYPEVLTVTAVADSDGLPGGVGGSPSCRSETDDTPADFSNWAATEQGRAHTIAAPGVCIQSTTPNGSYGAKSGTSMASPHVAGAVALCLDDAGNPGDCAGLEPAEVIEHMRDRADVHNAAQPGYGFSGDPRHSPNAGVYWGNMVAPPAIAAEDGVPSTRITAGPSGPSSDATAEFAFEADEPGAVFECRIDGGEFGPCSGEGSHTTAPLAAGEHVFEVRAGDADGNTDPTPASRAFQLDLTSPDTEITSRPADPSNSATPSFGFKSNESGVSFRCRFDDEPFAACSNPSYHRPATALADGPHTFEVKAVDPAGNADPDPAGGSVRVDTVKPGVTITPGQLSPTEDLTPSFELSADEPVSQFYCRIDSGWFVPCPASYTTPSLDEGDHRLEVYAFDSAGNATSPYVAVQFRIEGYPNTTIDPLPGNRTSDPTPTLTFSVDEPGVTAECRIDSDAWAACSGPGMSHTSAPLADGNHTFQVRALGAEGKLEPVAASMQFTVDTTPPETTISSGPSGTTMERRPEFGFWANETSTFECRFDSAPFAACSSSYYHRSSADLDAGPHTFEVRAVDRSGLRDQTPAARSFSIDLTAPQTSIDLAPADPDADRTPTFAFSADEPGATFQCRLDRVGSGANSYWQGCSGPGNTHTTAELADGRHTLEIRARDGAGNYDASPARHDWTVDGPEPETTITGGPAAGSRSSDPTPLFRFGADEQGTSFECRVDSDAFAACSGIAEHRTLPLADGSHDFEVRAVDADGHRDPSPASVQFWVDTTPPETRITDGPSGHTNYRTPYFYFDSPDYPVTFECRFDGAAFVPCNSWYSHRPDSALADGPHSFEVRARDGAGNVDPTPASRQFTVDTQTPETYFLTRPPDPTADPTPTFEFEADEEGARFECRMDGAAFAPCSGPGDSHTPPTTLDDARHWIEVRATDAAGNRDPLAARYEFTVETTRPDGRITGGPGAVSSDPTPTFEFDSDEEDVSFDCRMDSAAFAPCSGPGQSHTPASALPDGNHTFEVRATDADGEVDQSPASRIFRVDTVDPQTNISSGPNGLTAESYPRFYFSSNESGGSFQCRFDEAEWTPCYGTGYHRPATAIADGAHRFEVRAVDAGGLIDRTPALAEFTVDATRPTTTFVNPPERTDDSTPTFEFRADETGVTFQCRFDTSTFVACDDQAGRHTASVQLANGQHRFEVRATDRAGNVEYPAAAHTFMVGAAAPQTSLGINPGGFTSDPTPVFGFSADQVGSSFECEIDTLGFKPCGNGPTWEVSPALADGPHVFRVRARYGGESDQTPPEHRFTVDTVAPLVSITAGPEGRTLETSPSFEFESGESGVDFRCRIDQRPWRDCVDGFSDGMLAYGDHSFEVVGTDRAGNERAPARREFSVVEPDTSMGEPLGLRVIDAVAETADPRPGFRFAASEDGAQYECRIDDEPFGPCSGPGLVHRPAYELQDGSHSFAVRATIGVRREVVSTDFMVDRRPPQTVIAGGPPVILSVRPGPVLFRFSASEPGARFECRVDGAAFSSCRSGEPMLVENAGRHHFEVRAIDRLGNPDSSPAAAGFSVHPLPSACDLPSFHPVVGTKQAEELIGVGMPSLIDGKAGRDRLEGAGSPDCLLGGRGNDVLVGDGGDDLLRGGPGRDTISCGDGEDTVILDDKLDRIDKSCERIKRKKRR